MKYKSQGMQLTIDASKSSLEGLNKANRLVKFGDIFPWAEIGCLYAVRLNNGRRGAGNKLARMIIGALIIKHKMNLSDEETILAIAENPYMRYFVGLSEFTDHPIFDSSLFVTIRKRLGTADFNDMGVSLLELQLEKSISSEKKSNMDRKGRLHAGSLKMEATCSDVEVRYSTDIALLHDGCKVINRYIDKLCKGFSLVHPVTYYKEAHAAFHEVVKQGIPLWIITVGMHITKLTIWRNMSNFIGGALDFFRQERIYADKIYMNRNNRSLMKGLEIQAMGKPLGRPPKELQTKEYQKNKMPKAVGERNQIEATFGAGKRIYRANNIRVKLPDTANSWTVLCYFAKNVMKFLRELLRALFFVMNILVNQKRIPTKVIRLPRLAYYPILKRTFIP